MSDRSRMNDIGLPYRRHLGISLFLVIAAAIAGLQGSGPKLLSRERQRPVEGRRLEAGQTVRDSFSSDQDIRRYEIFLPVGQFFQAAVRASNLISATLYDPDGEKRNQIDDESMRHGNGRLSWVSDLTGVYCLELRQKSNINPGREYDLSVEPLRPARPVDRRIIEAEQACVLGGMLYGSREYGYRPAESIRKYEEAVTLFREAGELRREAEIHDLLIELYETVLDPGNAFAQCLRELAIWRALNDRDGEADALVDVSIYHRRFGEWQAALETGTQALAILESAGQLDEHPEAQLSIGELYREIGEPRIALQIYAPVLKSLKPEAPPRLRALAFGAMASAHALLAEYDQEIEWRKKEVEAWHAAGNRIPPEASAINSLAMACASAGRCGAAVEHLNTALRLFRSRENAYGEVKTLNNLGRVYLSCNDLPGARDAFQRALGVENYDGLLGPDLDAGMGETEALSGNGQAALEYYRKALNVWRQRRSWMSEAEALRRIAEIEGETGDVAAARRSMEEALEIIESSRGRIAGPNFRASYAASKRPFYESYIDLLMSADRRVSAGGSAALALRVSERARMHGLLEMIEEGRMELRRNADPDILRKERNLTQEIVKIREQLASASPRESDRMERLQATLDTLLRSYEETEAHMRAGSPQYAALVLPPPPPADAIQSMLDPDTLLLEFWTGGKSGYLWAIARDGISVHVLPGIRQLERDVASLYSLLARTPVAGESNLQRQERRRLSHLEYREKAAALSRTILGPVVDRLAKKRLLVSADGPLLYLPFAALPVPDSRAGEWLVQDHEIVNIPSVSVLSALKRRSTGQPIGGRSTLVVADPVFDKDDPRVERARRAPVSLSRERRALPAPSLFYRASKDAGLSSVPPRLLGSREEAARILASAGPGGSRALLGFDASRSSVTAGALGDYRIVHFATHGVVDDVHPQLSGLILSLVDRKGTPQEGFIPLCEILNLRLRAELVVLSACNTALGKHVYGEGLVGLSQGFMAAGAQRVLATLWRIDDEAAAQEMGLFYQALMGRGMAAASALRAAQLEMLASRRWKDPHFWAGFVLQGDW